jgi:hypothetical protein
MIESGGKTWFYLTADYTFGAQLQNAASKVVEAKGGKNLGAVRVPLSTADFSSFLLQAQASGAQVLGLANAGHDFTNSLKAANEFGITRTMRPVALDAYITDIHSLGLQTAQGLFLTTAWYWDLNDDTRAFAKRYFAKMTKEPTMNQAAYYSATLTYLKTVKAVGTTDSDKVMAELKRTKINDMFVKGGYIRADGGDDPSHVRHAGEVTAGIEVPMGLLQGGEADERGGGFRSHHRSLPAESRVTDAVHRGTVFAPEKPFRTSRHPPGFSRHTACVRNDSRDEVLLHQDDHNQHQGQHDAVHEGAGENHSFLSFQLGHRGASRNVLRRDHLPHDTSGGVGRREQHGIQVELPRRDHLQIAEQRVAGGVTA